MERWRDVKGYEGLYQISSLGRVKSLVGKGNNQYSNRENILKPYLDKDGYETVGLRGKGKPKTAKVHRLVAEAFIPNPKRFPQINHKNEIRDDNHAENLEWCTNRYNLNYGNHNQKMAQTLRKIKPSKPVLQFNLSGALKHRWNSLHEIERSLGYRHGNISRCCKGLYKQAYGYIWKFESEVNTNA